MLTLPYYRLRVRHYLSHHQHQSHQPNLKLPYPQQMTQHHPLHPLHPLQPRHLLPRSRGYPVPPNPRCQVAVPALRAHHRFTSLTAPCHLPLTPPSHLGLQRNPRSTISKKRKLLKRKPPVKRLPKKERLRRKLPRKRRRRKTRLPKRKPRRYVQLTLMQNFNSRLSQE